MNKIKLVYDWYTPHFPLNNNQPSWENIMDRVNNYDPETYNYKIQNKLFPFRTMEIFKNIEGYEYVPSSLVKDNDFFMYELTVEMDETNWISNPEIDIFKYTKISPFLLDQIKTKRGYILIEVCHESPLVFGFLDNLHQYFIKHDIPTSKIILLTGSINATELYHQYCDSKEIVGRDRMTVIGYEWFEYLTSRDMFLSDKIPQITSNFLKIQRTFLCLNRRFKPHRTDLYVLFYKYGLIPRSFYSMPVIADDPSEITWKENYRKEEQITTNSSIGKTKKLFAALYKLNDDEELNHVNGLLPLKVDSRLTLDEMLRIYDEEQSLYDSSLLSVVTESNFYGFDVFNTEKTFKAIANRHPFIIVGPHKTLHYLKTLGYKTFSDFFDEGYDNIADPTVRLVNIANLCKEIEEWSWSHKRDFFHEVVKITDHNFNLLKSIYPNNKRDEFWKDFLTYSI